MNKFDEKGRLSPKKLSIHSIVESRFLKSPDDDDDDDDEYDEDDNDDSYEDDGEFDEDYSSESNSDNYTVKCKNVVSLVLRNEAFSFDIPKVSEKFVDATLMEVNKLLKKRAKSSGVRTLVAEETVKSTDSQNVLQSKEPCSVEELYSDTNILKHIDTNWPKISEFNIKLGLEKLEKYVSTWKRSFDWMFCVEFLGFECEDASNVFVYEVEWSKPTPEYPIPQTTASVYFALEVFKIIPYEYDRNVDVSYIFEGSNVIHYPGKIDFQEKWLDDIMEAKLKFFKSITFSEFKARNMLIIYKTIKYSTKLKGSKRNKIMLIAVDCEL